VELVLASGGEAAVEAGGEEFSYTVSDGVDGSAVGVVKLVTWAVPVAVDLVS